MNSLDDYLAPNHVIGYAGNALITIAAATAAKDLYRIGYASVTLVGETFSSDTANKQWYQERKTEQIEALQKSWKQDIITIIGCGIGGYYAHRYIAPMAEELSHSWDQAVEVLKETNKVNFTEKVQEFSTTLNDAQNAVKEMTEVSQKTSDNINTLNTIAEETLNALDSSKLSSDIERFQGVLTDATYTAQHLMESANTTMANAIKTSESINKTAESAKNSAEEVNKILENVDSLVSNTKIPFPFAKN